MYTKIILLISIIFLSYPLSSKTKVSSIASPTELTEFDLNIDVASDNFLSAIKNLFSSIKDAGKKAASYIKGKLSGKQSSAMDSDVEKYFKDQGIDYEQLIADCKEKMEYFTSIGIEMRYQKQQLINRINEGTYDFGGESLVSRMKNVAEYCYE
ncbi:MAG: hypothetical protein KC505_00490 [Myxococcales bacterium]|nr:hypothetical protein [Myxococcales bacterium]USN50168.1 MAG: hypothetical protein H6731_07820 [Myxococcales bacterium]